MKKFLMICVALLMFSSIAMAKSSLVDRDNPIGVGADITVINFDSDFVKSVNIDVRRDTANEETSAYLMIHIDLDNILNSLGE